MTLKPIGITTTVPIEILLTAGYRAVDLNNLFITSKNYLEYIELAERRGFPKSLCAWIKGLYGVCKKNGIKTIVALEEGDCSNTAVLNQILESDDIKTIAFRYPTSHNRDDLKREIDCFMTELDVDPVEVENRRLELNSVRTLVKEIDLLSYREFKVTGFENHLYQVSCSDFNGDYKKYETELKETIKEIRLRESLEPRIKIGYLGVPPMTGDIYDYIEELGARVIYNEVQREFAFPRANCAKNIYDQYHDYTYVYSTEFRLKEIKRQIELRELDAVIHYTQAFCHKALEDILIKRALDIPVLNIEGDKQNLLDARTKLRIEAFIDMLIDKKEME